MFYSYFKVPLCESRFNVYKSLMIEQVDLERDNTFIEYDVFYEGPHHNIEQEIETIGDNKEQLYKLFFNVMVEFSGLTDNEIKQLYPPLEV